MATRRAVLSGAIAAATSPMVAMASKPESLPASHVSTEPLSSVAAASPEIQELWARYVAAFNASERFNEGPSLRDTLIARWGNAADWTHDPDYSRLLEQNEESDQLTDFEYACFNDFMNYPAKSVADLAYKLVAVLGVWRKTKPLGDGPELHEELAMSFFDEMEKVLGPLMPTGRSGT